MHLTTAATRSNPHLPLPHPPSHHGYHTILTRSAVPAAPPQATQQWNETTLQPWAAQTGQLIQEHTASFAGHVRVWMWDGPAETWTQRGTDVDGVLRGKLITPEKAFSALEGGFGFCDDGDQQGGARCAGEAPGGGAPEDPGGEPGPREDLAEALAPADLQGAQVVDTLLKAEFGEPRSSRSTSTPSSSSCCAILPRSLHWRCMHLSKRAWRRQQRPKA